MWRRAKEGGREHKQRECVGMKRFLRQLGARALKRDAVRYCQYLEPSSPFDLNLDATRFRWACAYVVEYILRTYVINRPSVINELRLRVNLDGCLYTIPVVKLCDISPGTLVSTESFTYQGSQSLRVEVW